MGEPIALAVHRCRFVDYAPSAITAIAFPPLPLPSVQSKRMTQGRQLKFGTLAVGHANGNIDLCEWAGGEWAIQSSQAWVVRETLSGLYPSKVDSIALVIRHPDDLEPDNVPSCSDLRLFSSGGGSELLEWDIDRSCVRRSIGSQGGSIWCMAANPGCTLLALGCEDGTVRLLTLENDTLTHYRRFDRVKCRVLSIAWGPLVPRQHAKSKSVQEDGSSDDDDAEKDTWDDSWLVTGGSDSSLRKWDVATGRVLDKMGTDKIPGERTLVWTVGVLGDGTIVSGDSLGMVIFWDSRTCTQLQSFRGHGADVLCLTVGPEGKTVYTSGVDQKVTQFSLVQTSTTGQATNTSSTQWIQSFSRRLHSHDVRTLATWPPYTPLPTRHRRQFPIDIAPILASGGLDMSVVVTPAALASATVVKVMNPLLTSADCTYENSYHRRLAYTSGTSSSSAVQIAPQARLVSCMRDSGLTVWRIPQKPPSQEEEDLIEDQAISGTTGWERVLEMELNVHSNLIASAMSGDGRWLVASDLYETKLFLLSNDAKGHLNLKRIRDFSSILQAHISSSPPSTGGQAFRFTPDSSKLVMSTAMSSYVLVIDLAGETPRVLRRFDHHRLRDSIVRDRVVKGRKTNGNVETGGATADTKQDCDEDDEGESDPSLPVVVNIPRIAISPDGQWLATSDNRSRTHIFNMDSIQHHSVLPSFSKPASVLSFDPTHPNVLIMAFPGNSLQVYDVESRQFPAWGRQLCSTLPKRLTHAHDPILGVEFDPRPLEAGAPQYALFWGSTWICKLLLKNLDDPGLSRKRRRESMKLSAPPLSAHTNDGRDFKMIMYYRPILCVGFLAARELVVVERPLIDVLSTLPPAYFKHKYGAS